jgi:hypothetical protein
MGRNLWSVIALPWISLQVAFASNYPQINATAHWATGSFAGGTWYTLEKPVLTSSGVSQNRRVFHSVGLVGAKIGSTVYSAFSSSSETVTNINDTTRRFQGTYVINGKTLQGQLFLYKSGRFTFQYRWTSSGVGLN